MIRALLVVASFIAVLAQDPCSVHSNCQICVNDVPNSCGWCSTRVVYRDGLMGGNCVSNNGKFPFACYGVFSTEDCLPGWTCDNSTYQCYEDVPGQGMPKAQCEATCGAAPPSPIPPLPPTPPPATTYVCNESSLTCEKSSPGHGTSLQVCQEQCKLIPPIAPVPPSPPSAPQQTYACNYTTWNCDPVAPGHGSSKDLCELSCQAPPAQYKCNFTSYQCEEVADGGTDRSTCEGGCVKLYYCDDSTLTCQISPYPNPGIPLDSCMDECKPSNNTPSDLVGLWRGIRVNKDNSIIGEWVINFAHFQVNLTGPVGTLSGSTQFYGTPERRLFSVSVTSSSVSAYKPGDVVEFWYTFDGASPETRFLMLAASASNQKAPTSWNAAYNANGFEWVMVECQFATNCSFHWPSTIKKQIRQLSILADDEAPVKANDPCSAHASSCSECLSNAFCGWCSVPVIYRDGTQGTQCAGSDGSRVQFKCSGVYRTDSCNDYECVQPQGQCVKVPIGSGTSKSDCEQTCTATPSPPSGPLPPTPAPAKTYDCNTTDYTCFEVPPGHGSSKYLCEMGCHPPQPVAPSTPSPPTAPSAPAPTYACNQSSWTCERTAPGHGASLEVCQQACSPPPSPNNLIGTWYGIQIDNKYTPGEYVLKVDNDTFTMSRDNTALYSGAVTTAPVSGGLLIQMQDGSQFAAMYSENQGSQFLHITLVVGKGPNDLPTGWDVPWILGGENGNVFVFVKYNPRS